MHTGQFGCDSLGNLPVAQICWLEGPAILQNIAMYREVSGGAVLGGDFLEESKEDQGHPPTLLSRGGKNRKKQGSPFQSNSHQEIAPLSHF